MANWYPTLRGLVNDQVERAIRYIFDRVYGLEARLSALEGTRTVAPDIAGEVQKYLKSSSGAGLIGALAQPLIGQQVDSQLATIGTGTGTVTSVALSLPAIFSVSGSPVLSTGTLTGSLVVQSANRVWAGPTGGGAATPTFRVLVAADLPADAVQSTASKITAAAPYANDGYIVCLINGVSTKVMTTA